MSLPSFDQTMLPILKVLSDGQTKTMSEIIESLELNSFILSNTEKADLLPNGRRKFDDRIGWGRTYLKKAGLVEIPDRGHVRITDEGIKVVQSGLDKIDIRFLSQYPSFLEFRSRNRQKDTEYPIEVGVQELSPQDMIDSGYAKVTSELQDQLLEKLRAANPYFFERIVLQLFQKMGYGEFESTPKSGDGGIDGVLNQDKLGLEKICVQAKRYADGNIIREPLIRNFIGAMSSDSSKGIFVTTSTFDDGAIGKARSAPQKIVLIDGEKLTALMINYGVGVQIKASYDVRELDADFFETY